MLFLEWSICAESKTLLPLMVPYDSQLLESHIRFVYNVKTNVIIMVAFAVGLKAFSLITPLESKPSKMDPYWPNPSYVNNTCYSPSLSHWFAIRIFKVLWILS